MRGGAEEDDVDENDAGTGSRDGGTNDASLQEQLLLRLSEQPITVSIKRATGRGRMDM